MHIRRPGAQAQFAFGMAQMFGAALAALLLGRHRTERDFDRDRDRHDCVNPHESGSLSPPVTRRAVLAAVLGLFVACAQPGGEVRRELRALVPRTVPSGPLPPAVVVQNNRGIEASWTVELNGSWVNYSKWLEVSLAPDYKLKAATSHEVVFVQVLEADTYRLQISVDDRAIRVTFFASPF